MTRRAQEDDRAVVRFDDEVKTHHRRVDTADWETIYVVGDVHGCRRAFERLLTKLDVSASDLVVCVGDLVRKGPDSSGTLDLVRERENVLAVRGNNEQGLIRGTKTAPDVDEQDLSFVETLPLVVSWGDSLVVHGGIDQRKPLSDHSPVDVLTTRSLTGSGYERPYWFEKRTERPRVFFGHTVLSEPFETEYAVGLDTGCVYGGELTAYDCSTGAFVSVEPSETYQHRSEEAIVTPHPKAGQMEEQ